MSTSSSECECDYLQYCGPWSNKMESPWYPTFGQPLIYYSQVQPFSRRQRNKETENHKPNYFKKAFRWYTQERVPFKNSDSSRNLDKTDVKGFAAWLDEKYNEFLQTNQTERTKYILTQTSTVEMAKITNYEQFEQPMAKKYKRVKSPWNKRKKCLNSKEKGDLLMKSNQSIEIILKPKDLSRPASEYFQKSKVQTCCNRSSSTVGSNASTPRVTKQKSQSLTSVKKMYMMPFGIPNYGTKTDECECKKSSKHKIVKKDPRRKKEKYSLRHVSCQCSKYMYEKHDAYSQIEDRGINGSDPCTCKLNNPEVVCSFSNRNLEKKQDLVTSGTSTRVIKPSKSSECIPQVEETRFMAPSMSTEKNRAAFVAPVNDCVQTSNYSINLDQNMFPEYPLFMKIICADKLKEN
ncbi:uncharacterized protein LOC123864792 isoform X2 [Maniola jurtina]|uniref:uncharacterized protein LOC123864792 isoform X2 n=1 Tax=Maniola jurtina TaxID=191418 RepID=UPI001E687957|nr:uncharacterized protein LOC123864792 isoform X2 [Maniola jurtina]